jgi:hypothetical protein
MKHNIEVAMFPNKKGKLPLHLRMIRTFFLWMLTSLTFMAPKTARKMFFDAQLTTEFRERLWTLQRSRQSCSGRKLSPMRCYICPYKWVDVGGFQTSFAMMKKINFPWNGTCEASAKWYLLWFPCNSIWSHQRFPLPISLMCAGMSSKSGYSALDIHCIQRNIPNEVRKEEIDVRFVH